MELSNPVLSGLIRKRQEVAAEMDAAQSKVRQPMLDIDALDATIRLFQPDIDLNRVQLENHGPARLGLENVSATSCP